jgi:hypothetical protein
VDATGNVFVADTGNNAVKEVPYNSSTGTYGTVTTIGSGFSQPYGVAVDAAGDVFVGDFAEPAYNALREVLPDHTTIKTLGSFFSAEGVAVDAAGDVFVADGTNNRVVELSPPTVAATPSPLTGSTVTAVSASLTGLSPNTTYYYRAVASPGTVVGQTQSFFTGQTTLSVTVSDAGGTYNGGAFAATALVNGAASLEGVSPTLTYYAGSQASGTPLSGAPSAAGTYTVVAAFAGSADYAAAASAPLTFTITPATPTVSVSDAGGAYDGAAFAASATVAGVGGTPAANLEGVAPTLSYYSGAYTSVAQLAGLTPLAGAPVNAGTYTVLATFPGSADYNAAQALATFTITQAGPSVTVSDAGGTYNGGVFAATAQVNGSASLEGVSTTLTYYAGSQASGTPLSGAPSAAGTYTVVAAFVGSADYSAAASNPLTFTISPATPSVTVSDAGGTYHGAAFPATALVNGAASLEGVSPTLTYYVGSQASGTPLSAAPSAAGTYTVVAAFAGSADYGAATSAPLTFTISPATPSVTVSDAGGIYNGGAFAASAAVAGAGGTPAATLEGVAPTLSYYSGAYTSVAQLAGLTPLAGAPVNAGAYTVLATFPGSADYSAAQALAAFTITQSGPSVTVSDAGGTYHGGAFAATALVNGAASLEGVSPTLTYYVGSQASGTPLAGAPSQAGTYTVVAAFAGSADYSAAASAPLTFTISPATPSVTVSDAGGTYHGGAFAASATVAGVDAAPAATLEGVAPTLSYYSGSYTSVAQLAGLTPLAGAPVNAGAYTVLATFPGSADYSAAQALAAFTITQSGPSVTVSDAGGTYNGGAFAATALVNGAASLEGVSPTLTYYVGSQASGTPLAGAPSAAGTYTVVAAFAGSADYGAATSAPLTFTITPATPSVTVSDAGGTYNGGAFAATAQVNGAGSLEGVSPTLTYYAGSQASGTPLSGAPSQAGTYTVVAAFPGSADYGAATSAPLTFTISPATLTITPATGQSKVYGAAVPALSYTASGLVNNDPPSTLKGALVTTATDASPVGTYAITLGTLAAGSNYTVALAANPPTFAVTKATLTITANSTSKTYGQSLAFAGTEFTVSGLVNGDTVSGVTLTSAGAAANAGVAGSPYAIVASSAVGSGLVNYTISYINGSLTVSPAALTVTADNQSMTYGGSVPTLTYHYTGLVNGDTSASFTGGLTTTATGSSVVGGYPITQGSLAATGNYTIATFKAGTLTVTPAPLAAGVNFSATAGAPFSGTVATFTTPDQTDSAAAYSAVITWGDGSTSNGVVSGSHGSFTVSGSHTYAAAATYAVSVQISSPSTQATTAHDTATVASLGLGVTNSQAGGVGWGTKIGLTAGIGFWQNPNGQALINSFNGGPSATALGNWLAASFPNLYGASAGANSLAGKTNAQVAAYFQALFSLGGTAVPAQGTSWGQPSGLGGTMVQAEVLATALSVYATTNSLGGTAGVAYGFTVSATGLGARCFNVGADGAAFGVANNSTLTVYGLLLAVNKLAVNGVLYGGNTTLQAQAAELFNALDQAGSI